jgi:MtN3 and saliva related transmembrane protein
VKRAGSREGAARLPAKLQTPNAHPVKSAEWLGWSSSAILLATLIRQVYTQWRSEDVAGVSRWLFIGQLTASAGFTAYSVLLHNWVYASSNIAILITAIAGEGIYIRNQHAHGGGATLKRRGSATRKR